MSSVSLFVGTFAPWIYTAQLQVMALGNKPKKPVNEAENEFLPGMNYQTSIMQNHAQSGLSKRLMKPNQVQNDSLTESQFIMLCRGRNG
jgi:hypothetical protein